MVYLPGNNSAFDWMEQTSMGVEETNQFLKAGRARMVEMTRTNCKRQVKTNKIIQYMPSYIYITLGRKSSMVKTYRQPKPKSIKNIVRRTAAMRLQTKLQS